ncbi:hypothetical protein Egran_03868 [Elaphomyces granulatus]|uniref:Peroxisomal ATPase PEX6 n=1 Tax=Elaphomyces granulatus TaxID=519963 RepID=A0A232LW19_9EURO|nr:hypothetical protein Egran_03868 [Elaphomyces granulatus]
MAAESLGYDSDQPKRRRKGLRGRVHPRAPISARLVLDSQLRGDVGVLSDDLVNDLFPWLDIGLDIKPEFLHIAISPYTPHFNAVDDLPWTIIPIQVQQRDRSQVASISHSTVILPASTSSLRSFLHARDRVDFARHPIQNQRVIEIRVLDVVPLHLDSVFVTVERHLLRNHDEIQSKFGGGFITNPQGVNGLWAKGGKATAVKKYSKRAAGEVVKRLTIAVREALSAQDIIHSGDVLPLPLPSHPITHAPPPPARISFCEPVAQGLLVPTTKIVLVQERPRGSRSHKTRTRGNPRLSREAGEDDAEDTSNEQFYSAAEEKPVESATEMESSSPPDESETEGSVGTASDSADDSLDDMISLTAPKLPQQPFESMSANSLATPRPGGRRVEGFHTPGSVLSNFTSGTARPPRGGGKVFKVEGLLKRVSIEALHPRPREDDDMDSFVFVDINALVKIGCFSGDWVRIETVEETQVNLFASLKHGGLNLEEAGNWRAVKVYGLPGLQSPKPRYSVGQPVNRRSSVSQLPFQRLTPIVFVPPILLSNLDCPKYVKISPLASSLASRSGVSQQSKSFNKFPPVAKEVTLLKISTPLSMDRALQPALFAGLKRYFELKRRILKSGDLVGISVDEWLGRAVSLGIMSADGGNLDDELTTTLSCVTDAPQTDSGGKKCVAWFRVGQITPVITEDSEERVDEQWGGMAIIDSSSTRMVQAGSIASKVPGTLENGWEYWLGVKMVPKSIGEFSPPHRLLIDQPKSFVPPIQKRLRELMSASTNLRAIQLGMPPVVVLLKSTQRNIGKSTVLARACMDIGLHCFTVDAFDILTEGGANGGDVKTEAFLKARADRAFSCGPSYTVLLIKHIEVLTADRMITAMKEIVSESRIVAATTTDVEKIPEGIRSLFTHELELVAPEEKEREGILRNAIFERGIKISADVDLAAVAIKTAALVAGDLVDVVERASAAMTTRLEKLVESVGSHSEIVTTLRDIQVAGGYAARCVTKADFDAAVDAARKNFADAIGAPKIPNVSWDDVGGLTNVKEAVMETIQLPLERPELFAKGMKKRSGILFYGPPGTGKTLLAKAIATEFSLNFFSVKGPELLNMYIGESEANVRRVFQRARDARPCVVFFDELDSVAPKRGNQGDSGGVMDRIVSQLLAELDGMSNGDENGGGVFVIGATNRPDLLDAALLRPGRFDKMLYLGVSDTHEKQTRILEALTRKFTLHPDVSLPRIAERLPFTYTGADLYALCSDAMLKAITRQATAVDRKIEALPDGPVSTAFFFDHFATPEDVMVVVTEQDFMDAESELVASVSAKELEHFDRIRCTFESDNTQKNVTGMPDRRPAEIPSSTIADVIDGLTQNNETSIPGLIMANGSFHASDSKGKGKDGASSLRSASEPDSTIGRNRGRSSIANLGGKGKSKTVDTGGGDSDSSLDGFSSSIRNDNAFSHGYGGLGADDDGDDYIVRTDHLKS